MRVLIAEDDDALRVLLVDLLRDEGHEVSEASDGDLALMVLRGRPIDLTLLDLTLPTLNGEWVLRFMETRRLMSKHARVIVITGSVDTAAARLEGLPVETILYKPFSVEQILDAIQPPLCDGTGSAPHGRSAD